MLYTALSPTPRVQRAVALAVALAALALLAAGCDGGGTDDAFADDLVGRLQARDRYVPLADALELTGLDDDLRTGGPYTVLAPTRTAFAYVGTDFSPVLFAEPQRQALARVLRHHVVPGRLGPEAFTDGAVLTAVDGTTLTVRRVGPVATVNGVTVDLADPTEGTDGVAYPLADVLVDVLTGSERVRLSPLLSTFAAGLRATGVQAGGAGPGRVTVLAPTNDAFTGLGAGLAFLTATTNTDVFARALRAQVLPGDVDLGSLVGQTVTTLGGDRLAVTRDGATGVLRVDGVRVLHGEATADGRLYVLGEPVLSVLSLDERLRIRADLTLYEEYVRAAPALRARLGDRAEGLTVFAPPNSFYAGRNPELVAILGEPAQAPLVRRLTAVRVVVGRITPADLVDGARLTTVDGTVLTVERVGDVVLIDNFPLVLGEPERAVNGLLYTTDVRLPPPDNLGLVETILVTGRPLLFRAVQRAGLEAAYRTTVRTAFVPTEQAIIDEGLLERGGDTLAVVMRRTATTAFLPDLSALSAPYTFTALDGSTRTILRDDLLFLDDREGGAGTQVLQGATTSDGRAALHRTTTVDFPR
jgi:uncharacterized surface protein with fasciclin (FAS1) repeats